MVAIVTTTRWNGFIAIVPASASAGKGHCLGVVALPDSETTRRLREKLVLDYAERAPKAVELPEAGFEDAMAIMTLPEHYRRRLQTTNGVERLNGDP